MVSSSEPRRRAGVLASFIEGWRRAMRAPWIAVGMLGATFFSVALLALIPHQPPGTHLTIQWVSGPPVEQTLGYEVVGFGGTLANLSGWLDRDTIRPELMLSAGVYIVLWV